MRQPTVVLTQEQIDFFHREGYLTIEALTTQEEVATMRGWYDRMFAQKAGRERGDQFDLAGPDEEGRQASLPQILNPERYCPELRDTLLRVNAQAVARQLIGEQANGGGAHAILKPAQHGAVTPWHQDEAYWAPGFDYNTISIWVPLQDVNEENGCMCFIPGSHRMEVLPHHSINHDPRVHGLEVDDVPEFDPSTAVACPLKAGGATIHPSRTFHYTGPNRTDGDRRAYILSYGTPATPRATPRRFPWNEMKQTAREARARAAQADDLGQKPSSVFESR